MQNLETIRWLNLLMNIVSQCTWDQASASALSIYAFWNRTLPTEIHLHWLVTPSYPYLYHTFILPSTDNILGFLRPRTWRLKDDLPHCRYPIANQHDTNIPEDLNCHHCENLNLTSLRTTEKFSQMFPCLIYEGCFFFQPPIVLLRKYEIRGSQICASRDCAAPPPQPLPLSAPMRQS